MELIPILSTIILVATISTFILAVGAYILYKIREGKVKISPGRKPEYLEAEYFVPKEKKEHKVFVEEILEPKTNLEKKKEELRTVRSAGEKENEPKYRVVDNLMRDSNNARPVKEYEVEMPKLKFEKYSLSQKELPSEDTIHEEIKWR